MSEPDEDVFHTRIQKRRDRRQLQMTVAFVAIGVVAFLLIISGMR